MSNLAQTLLYRITGQRKIILFVGDALVDRWIHGHTETCQDGCVKFMQEDGVCSTPGGSANAERCLQHWNIETHLFGHWKELRGIKTRFINQNGNIVFRYDQDEWAGGSEYDTTRDNALKWIRTANAVLLSDYDKGFLTPEFIKQVSSICKGLGIPCVADAKREPEIYAGAIIKCNEDYYKRNFEQICSTTKYWVETKGPNSPYIQWIKGLVCPEMLPVACVNHVGAGDCFAAHLTLALAYGLFLPEAAALAHSAGRVYVQHPHNRPPLPEEIAADLELESRTANLEIVSRNT